MARKLRLATEIPVLNGEVYEPTAQKDKSPYVFQREKISRPVTIRELPWTPKQREFIDLALDKETKVLLVKGPAGTSKTLLAVYVALQLLNLNRVSEIITVRAPVESSDSKLGFLPGTAEDKMSEYLVPFIDKLDELLNSGDQTFLIKDQRVQAIPVGFMRGRHLAVKAVILDEAQNCTISELTTIITRMGMFSKLFMLGDPQQSDLSNGKRHGFSNFYELFDDEESRKQGIFTFEFGVDDILRSELVKYVVTKLAAFSSKKV
jgi:phosphate starvation-inducible PhoH-like protein